jgi:tetratricopeptide (TPR) repeat protein
MGRADSIFDENRPEEGPTTVERQWVIRLENGETKTCRELATLQQWIVSNVVSRESLISRTGKTWKRLGDITELAQYFNIADEARTGRTQKQPKPNPTAGTMLGVGASAAGGTILPDDEEETGRATGNFRTQPATPVPPTRTPPMGSNIATPPRRPITPPPMAPPNPQPKTPTGPVALATAPTLPAPRPSAPTPQPPSPSKGPPIPEGRSTALWANDPIKGTSGPSGGPSGPSVGKFGGIVDEPAFAGRVRVSPSDESSFDTGRVGMVDDDDDLMPRRGGSKAGIIILVMMLLVGAGAAAVVYLFVIKKDDSNVAVVNDAGSGGSATPDAVEVVVAPIIDAPEVAPPTPLETARAELGQNVEPRLRTQLEALAKDAPETQALRANLAAAIVQSLNDRAGLVADKNEADKLRKESKTLVLDAATAAQRALKTAPEDPAANIAMAHVLRLQGKSIKDMQRYLDAAKPKAGAEWSRDLSLAEALVHARDGKLDDARKALEAIDSGPNKLETSNDVRARFHLALIALAQNRAADSKAAVDQILAAQPEHAGAKALAAKLETKTSATDPLPPEEPKDPGKGSSSNTGVKPPTGSDVSTTGNYDQLLARANKLAETSCGKAMELFTKALEQKPNGVEALSGQGYCHIDAKQFASAFSKFRSALAISPRYEPALWGVAEAYQQQGRKEQALESYKAYLEAYPGSAKAQKQIERLQGSAPTPTPGSGSAPTPTPTTPTPTPTPPPQDPTQQPQKPDAPPEGGGSGAQ